MGYCATTRATVTTFAQRRRVYTFTYCTSSAVIVAMNGCGWQPPSNRTQAPDGHGAHAIRGVGASARQTTEANKSAVGVVMQYLVMIDKLHDMHERRVISDLHFAQWSGWACEHVASLCTRSTA